MKTRTKQSKQGKAATTPSPHTEIEAFVSEHKKLLHALDVAEKRASAAEQELIARRRDLAQAQARALATDPDVDPELHSKAESGRFVEANLKSAQAKAAVEGCRNALARSDLGILSHAQKLCGLRANFNRGAVRQFLGTVFAPAIEAFAAILKQGRALEEALGEEIPDLHQLPATDGWREDEKAAALFDGSNKLKLLADSLQEFQRGSGQRALVLERAKRQRPGFDPSNDAKYRVSREFRCYGRPFTAGSIVTCYEIDSVLLSKLYNSRHLELMEPAMEGRNAQ